MNHDEKKKLIVPGHEEISLLRQAELLDISRSSLYYEPIVDEEDIRAMNGIDEITTKLPFYGSRRIKPELKENYDIDIGRHHIRRLLGIMGIETIYPKKNENTSVPDHSHKKYPYLLKDVAAAFPDHVWGTDITYVRTETGFAYLVAIIDWFSRYVIAWELSLTMETDFCVAALENALSVATPKIHNSDQGSQFTSNDYVGILEKAEIGISMDGRGRCMDNIFTERLWRTVKYEDIYLRSYRDYAETKKGLRSYFEFYNGERRHQALEYRTPTEVYFGKS